MKNNVVPLRPNMHFLSKEKEQAAKETDEILEQLIQIVIEIDSPLKSKILEKNNVVPFKRKPN